jgi:hypothetical protein
VGTPDDPAVDDGFYTIYSPAGTQVFTASLNGYGADYAALPVTAGDTLGYDFFLDAGWLTYDPAALEDTLFLGTVDTIPFTITNNGGASASYELGEADRGFAPFWPTGRPAYKPRSKPSSAPEDKAPATVLKTLETLSPEVWGTRAALPGTTRYRSAGVSCDGQGLYVFGGQPSSGGVINEVWYYDLASDTWTAKAPMPVALMSMEATCIDGYIYLVGGYTGSAHTNNFQIYDTAGDVWAATTWPNTLTPMTAAWNGMLYAFGGNPGPSNVVWVYDPATGVWANTGSTMPTATSYGGATTVGDYIYVVGGGATGATQRYDPVANTWATGPSLPATRMNAILVWYGDFLYAASGGGLGGDIWAGFADTLVYDYTAFPGGAWVAQGETVPTPVVGAAYDCIGTSIDAAVGTSGGTYYAINQYLDDGQACHFGGFDPVPWLSEAPITGTVASGASAVLDITFDATVPEVNQPGEYMAKLLVDNDTPYGVDTILVTMTVLAPPAYGMLEGTVTGLGYCDVNPWPLNDATLFLQGANGYTTTLETDAYGYYQWWLDQMYGPVTLTVTAPGHELIIITDIAISGGITTTQNFDLRWMQPCVGETPGYMEVTLPLGGSTTLPMTVTNLGAVDAEVALNEMPGGFAPAARATAGGVPNGVRPIELSVSNSAPLNAPAQPWAPSGPVNLVLDDGTVENGIGLTAGGQFVWLNRFTPDPADFPFVLDQVSMLFGNTVTVGDDIEIVIWQDTDGDGDPSTGTEVLYYEWFTVLYNDDLTWNDFVLSSPVLLTGPGDVLVGAVNRSGAAGDGKYPASIDQTASQQRSWVGIYAAGDPPEPPTLPADSDFLIIDDAGLAGNWTMRASGFTGGLDVPWLSESPITATVPAYWPLMAEAYDIPAWPTATGTPQANPGLSMAAPQGAGVFAPAAPLLPDAVVLWDQPLSMAYPWAIANQDFPDAAAYSAFMADDFIVTEPWMLQRIFTPGDLWNGGTTLMNADLLVWEIYSDNAGLPGDLVWGFAVPPTDPRVTLSAGYSGYPSDATLLVHLLPGDGLRGGRPVRPASFRDRERLHR